MFKRDERYLYAYNLVVQSSRSLLGQIDIVWLGVGREALLYPALGLDIYVQIGAWRNYHKQRS